MKRLLHIPTGKLVNNFSTFSKVNQIFQIGIFVENKNELALCELVSFEMFLTKGFQNYLQCTPFPGGFTLYLNEFEEIEI